MGLLLRSRPPYSFPDLTAICSSAGQVPISQPIAGPTGVLFQHRRGWEFWEATNESYEAKRERGKERAKSLSCLHSLCVTLAAFGDCLLCLLSLFLFFFFFDCSLRLPWTTSKTIAASLFISFISHTTSFSVSCPFHHFAHYDHTVHQSCMLAQVVQIRVVRVALSISCSLPLLLSYP